MNTPVPPGVMSGREAVGALQGLLEQVRAEDAERTDFLFALDLSPIHMGPRDGQRLEDMLVRPRSWTVEDRDWIDRMRAKYTGRLGLSVTSHPR